MSINQNQNQNNYVLWFQDGFQANYHSGNNSNISIQQINIDKIEQKFLFIKENVLKNIEDSRPVAKVMG